MEEFYNHETFLLFLGGICSVLLAVVIIFGKQEYKRALKRDELKLEAKEKNQSATAEDIEAKLNDSYEFRRIDFFEKLTQWGLQPLFIISFINLFSKPNVYELLLTFVLMLFTISHELWSSIQFSKKKAYQILLLSSWVVLFMLISYRTNHLQKQVMQQSTEQTKEK